ncbi:26S protease regulatory subunit 6A [Entamoeba marina]
MDGFTEEEFATLNDHDVLSMSTEQIKQRIKQIERQEGVIKHDHERIRQELAGINKQNKENREKIDMYAKLPFLISNVVEILDLPPEEMDDGSGLDNKSFSSKGVVISTSMRSNVFLPVSGLVDVNDIKPGDLVGVNKDTYLILEKLPEQYDGRVKSMEVIDRPTETYNDVGGLDKQMNEMIEAIVLPMTHKEKFEKLGIQTPKGVLLYGPPGTGKTLMARACAAQTQSTFLKLAAPQLVSSSIGDGSRIIRDMFALAKSKAPAIIFIDEIDAIGIKRNDSEHSGDREIQRTMLELLNQLDGFSKTDDVRVIGATNRVDVLDPALLRSGRFDRKIEFPHPNEEARVNILQIHSKKLKTADDINFEELARSTPDFNGAQLKAVCVEAGMFALRREALVIRHEDFQQGISEVQSKKKKSLSYFA